MRDDITVVVAFLHIDDQNPPHTIPGTTVRRPRSIRRDQTIARRCGSIDGEGGLELELRASEPHVVRVILEGPPDHANAHAIAASDNKQLHYLKTWLEQHNLAVQAARAEILPHADSHLAAAALRPNDGDWAADDGESAVVDAGPRRSLPADTRAILQHYSSTVPGWQTLVRAQSW